MKDINLIKCMYAQGASIEALSIKFFCHPSLIREIITGRYELRKDISGKVFTINDKEPRCTAT